MRPKPKTRKPEGPVTYSPPQGSGIAAAPRHTEFDEKRYAVKSLRNNFSRVVDIVHRSFIPSQNDRDAVGQALHEMHVAVHTAAEAIEARDPAPSPTIEK